MIKTRLFEYLDVPSTESWLESSSVHRNSRGLLDTLTELPEGWINLQRFLEINFKDSSTEEKFSEVPFLAILNFTANEVSSSSSTSSSSFQTWGILHRRLGEPSIYRALNKDSTRRTSFFTYYLIFFDNVKLSRCIPPNSCGTFASEFSIQLRTSPQIEFPQLLHSQALKQALKSEIEKNEYMNDENVDGSQRRHNFILNLDTPLHSLISIPSSAVEGDKMYINV